MMATDPQALARELERLAKQMIQPQDEALLRRAVLALLGVEGEGGG